MKRKEPVCGDIVVRTGKTSWQPTAKIGKIVKLNFISYSNNSVAYDNYITLEDKHWRYATDNEIKAFKSGIKHINDVVNDSIDCFSII